MDLELFTSVLQLMLHQFGPGWLNCRSLEEEKVLTLDADCLREVLGVF
jgi:hypothetical protein